jgi:hypothetical protein
MESTINPFELRLGNVVSLKYDRKDLYTNHIVLEIRSNDLLLNNMAHLENKEAGKPLEFKNTRQVKRYIPYDEIVGIPAKADILWKCGFVPADEDGNYLLLISQVQRLYISYNSVTGYAALFTYSPTEKSVFIPFEKPKPFLHQVQNLYNEIVGKELEVQI